MPAVETATQLPLLSTTPLAWAELAAKRLDVFLADHAVCEQQAAASALSFIGHYPDDAQLVEKMATLAAEEISHFRRVTSLLHSRGLAVGRRRPNTYVRGLKAAIDVSSEPELKADRLFVSALIEARSCERFTRLLDAIDDPEIVDLLADLGPAEARHWRMFHDLACREASSKYLDSRWRHWLEVERDLMNGRGQAPTVHG